MRRTLPAILFWLLAAVAEAAGPVNYYVDPGGGNDTTGDGSLSTPWATVQHALDTISPDPTYGDQINIKAGTDDTLAASLDMTTYGTPAASTPLVLRGYSSAADDGGQGGIDCDGNSLFADTNLDYIVLIDLEIYNAGADEIIQLDNYISVIRCEIHGNSGNKAGVDIDNGGVIVGCHVYDVDGYGLFITSGGYFAHNYITNDGGSVDMTCAIRASNYCLVERNFISVDGATYGIQLLGTNSRAQNNSIYHSGKASAGIDVLTGALGEVIHSNLIENFANGVDCGSSALPFSVYHNTIFNCTTDIGFVGEEIDVIPASASQNNEIPSVSPFAKKDLSGDAAAAPTYATRYTWFAPVDTDSVYGGAWPEGNGVLDRGAVQHEATGGGTIISAH